MDTPVLVAHEITVGREAVDAFASSGLNPDVTAWVFDDDSEEWRLLVSVHAVADSGPADAYRRAFAALGSAGIDFPLAQLWLVDPADPGVIRLRRLTEAGPEDAVRAGGGVSIAGRTVSEAFIYDPRFIAYERDVVGALQRVRRGEVLRATTRLFDDPPAGVDFVIGFDTGTFAFVSVKGGERAIPTFAVAPLVRYATSVPVLLVSRAVLTTEAAVQARQARRLLFVQWRDNSDDDGLAAAIEDLRGMGSDLEQ